MTIDVQTFQMVPTNPIPLHYPLSFSIRTMVLQIKTPGMYPSRNATCMTLTTLSHVSISGSFSLVAARNHALSCFALIPNGPPALPVRSFLTADTIPPTSGGPSLILTGCTKIGIMFPLEDVACTGLPAGLRFNPYAHWWGGLGVPWPLGTTVEFYSTPLKLDCSKLMSQSPLPLSSSCFSCPPSNPTETVALTPCVIPG